MSQTKAFRIENHFASFTKKDGEQYVLLKTALKPTLSPKDPGFAAWWETADALIIQAEAAKDAGKLDETLSFYEKAAELGNADVQFQCAQAFSSYGDGYTKGSAEERELYWYEKAAQQGHKDAQYKTGICYAFDKGTKKDNTEALKWFQASAKQGHGTARAAAMQGAIIICT